LSTAHSHSLSLHDALPICRRIPIIAATQHKGLVMAQIDDGNDVRIAFRGEPLLWSDLQGSSTVDLHEVRKVGRVRDRSKIRIPRSEEHTSELQSPCNLVCR